MCGMFSRGQIYYSRERNFNFSLSTTFTFNWMLLYLLLYALMSEERIIRNETVMWQDLRQLARSKYLARCMVGYWPTERQWREVEVLVEVSKCWMTRFQILMMIKIPDKMPSIFIRNHRLNRHNLSLPSSLFRFRGWKISWLDSDHQIVSWPQKPNFFVSAGSQRLLSFFNGLTARDIDLDGPWAPQRHC